jgi:hypothetical protein
MKNIFIIIQTLLFLLCAQGLFAQTTNPNPIPKVVTPFTFPSARYAALGGTHPAVADDFYTIFSNPAGLASIEYGLSIAELSADVKDWNTIYNIFFGPDAMAQLNTLIKNRLHAGADLGGPFALGYINRGFGIGFFNATRLNLVWDSTNALDVSVYFSEEAIFQTGYALRIAGMSRVTLDIGILAKGFFRLVYDHTFPMIDVRYFFDNLKTYSVQSQAGFGFDAGIKFTFVEAFAIGAVWHDVYWAPAWITNFENWDKFTSQVEIGHGETTVQQRVEIGFSYRVISMPFHQSFSDLIVMATYTGLTELFAEKPRDVRLDIRVGLELSLLEAFRLRVGFSELMPAFGVGIDFTAFKFDVAYYGQEFGLKPGQFSTYSLAFSFVFRYKLEDYLGSANYK